MKTRKQIIKKWEEEGYFLGTLQDAKNTFIINDGDDKYYENILSFKTRQKYYGKSKLPNIFIKIF